MGSMSVDHSVLNVKAIVGSFNQDYEPSVSDGPFSSSSHKSVCSLRGVWSSAQPSTAQVVTQASHFSHSIHWARINTTIKSLLILIITTISKRGGRPPPVSPAPLHRGEGHFYFYSNLPASKAKRRLLYSTLLKLFIDWKKLWKV